MILKLADKSMEWKVLEMPLALWLEIRCFVIKLQFFASHRCAGFGPDCLQIANEPVR